MAIDYSDVRGTVSVPWSRFLYILESVSRSYGPIFRYLRDVESFQWVLDNNVLINH